jgi:peptidoglycan hydrolase FlgJ
MKINSALTDAPSVENTVKQKKLDEKTKAAQEAAGQFETVFVNMMLKSMRDTAKPEEESNAMGIYGGMLDEEYGKSMSQTHSFGIKKAIFDWIQQNDPDLASSKKELDQLKSGELSTKATTNAIKGYQQSRL